MEMKERETQLPTYEEFKQAWAVDLARSLPDFQEQIDAFVTDEEFGLRHSYDVWKEAKRMAGDIKDSDGLALDDTILSHVATFHDIGKFFEKIHSLENISIAENVYGRFADVGAVTSNQRESVLDGIKRSDFYNKRLDPDGEPPLSLEADIVRAADKMQDNIVPKVDRYWYKYGVPRNATFFKPELTREEREQFNFSNFAGDQLNVILSIIAIRPEDFQHPIVQDAYRRWSEPKKQQVVERILALADEIGETPENIREITDIIRWYRERFGY